MSHSHTVGILCIALAVLAVSAHAARWGALGRASRAGAHLDSQHVATGHGEVRLWIFGTFITFCNCTTCMLRSQVCSCGGHV